jgi:DNA invertase Pin-like site-specific DNA recombinase
MDAGVEFTAVDNPHANKLTVHILAAVAQHEREMISERTTAALQAAKARGVRLGNPNLSKAAAVGRARAQEAAQQRADNVLPVIRELQAAGATSHNAVAKKLNARNVPTARGRKWSLGNHYVVVRDLAGLASRVHRFVSAGPIRAPHKKKNAIRRLCPPLQFFEAGC